HVFVRIQSLGQPIKCAPTHPLRFVKHIIVVASCEACLKAFNPCVGAVVTAHALRAIKSASLFSPVPLTGEALSGRHPKDRSPFARHWTQKIPTMSAKMPWHRRQRYRLVAGR